jgi:hypothetical protein
MTTDRPELSTGKMRKEVKGHPPAMNAFQQSALIGQQ